MIHTRLYQTSSEWTRWALRAPCSLCHTSLVSPRARYATVWPAAGCELCTSGTARPLASPARQYCGCQQCACAHPRAQRPPATCALLPEFTPEHSRPIMPALCHLLARQHCGSQQRASAQPRAQRPPATCVPAEWLPERSHICWPGNTVGPSKAQIPIPGPKASRHMRSCKRMPEQSQSSNLPCVHGSCWPGSAAGPSTASVPNPAPRAPTTWASRGPCLHFANI